MTNAGDRLSRFLLDTNFLMIPGKFKVDIFDQLNGFGKSQLFTIDLVIDELEKMAKGSGKDSSYARIALMLTAKEGIKIISTKEKRHTDTVIKAMAKHGHYVVCTQDRDLIKSLKRSKVPVISLRQKKFLKRV